jgi:hypothetical protein
VLNRLDRVRGIRDYQVFANIVMFLDSGQTEKGEEIRERCFNDEVIVTTRMSRWMTQ